MFTKSGKFGYVSKTLSSSKSVYTQFKLPISMIKDDELVIPIQVVNNRNFDQKIQVSVIETLFPSTIVSKSTSNY